MFDTNRVTSFWQKKLLLLAVATVAIVARVQAQQWNNVVLAPVVLSEVSATIPISQTSVSTDRRGIYILFTKAIEVYRRYISTQDIPSCVFKPTCSQFCLDALETHKVPEALLLTIDRLQRCHTGSTVSPFYHHDDAGKCQDPQTLYGNLDTLVSHTVVASGCKYMIHRYCLTSFRLFGSSCRFADMLFSLHEYTAAAREYAAAAVMELSVNDTLLYNTASAYFFAGNLDSASIFLSRMDSSFDTMIERKVADLRSAVFFLSGNTSKLRSHDGSSEFTKYLEALSYIEDEQWDLATQKVHGIGPENKWCAAANKIGEFADRHQHIPVRSPVTASMLSALFPGAGKVYSGASVDGVLAFISVAAPLGIALYSSHSAGRVTLSAVSFGCFSTVLYCTTIYGSWHAANRYNRYQQERLYDHFVQVSDSVITGCHP